MAINILYMLRICMKTIFAFKKNVTRPLCKHSKQNKIYLLIINLIYVCHAAVITS